jgi:hypothetical protein
MILYHGTRTEILKVPSGLDESSPVHMPNQTVRYSCGNAPMSQSRRLRCAMRRPGVYSMCCHLSTFKAKSFLGSAVRSVAVHMSLSRTQQFKCLLRGNKVQASLHKGKYNLASKIYDRHHVALVNNFREKLPKRQLTLWKCYNIRRYTSSSQRNYG